MPKTKHYCKTEDCERQVMSRALMLCTMHYKRLKKHGTTAEHTWKPRSGFTVPEDMRQRISETLKGRKLSDNHKDNIVKGMVGKVSHGEDSHMWKGDAIGYSGVHKWIRDQLGAPKLCENCDATSGVAFDWANLSYEYKRDVSDWARLCRRCHFLIDGVGLYMRTKKLGVQ